MPSSIAGVMFSRTKLCMSEIKKNIRPGGPRKTTKHRRGGRLKTHEAVPNPPPSAKEAHKRAMLSPKPPGSRDRSAASAGGGGTLAAEHARSRLLFGNKKFSGGAVAPQLGWGKRGRFRKKPVSPGRQKEAREASQHEGFHTSSQAEGCVPGRRKLEKNPLRQSVNFEKPRHFQLRSARMGSKFARSSETAEIKQHGEDQKGNTKRTRRLRQHPPAPNLGRMRKPQWRFPRRGAENGPPDWHDAMRMKGEKKERGELDHCGDTSILFSPKRVNC